MLTIRLQRAGKRNTPHYKVVLAQKTAANQKQFVEILGSYNPHSKSLTIRDNERLNYWMNEQHVELSSTVHNLFVTKELLKADKKRAFAIPAKPEEAKAEEMTPTTTTSEENATEEQVVAVEEVAPETASEQPAETSSDAPVVEPEPAVEPAPVPETPAEEKTE